MTRRRTRPGFSKIAVAYLRSSTDRQRLDAQRDAIAAWAIANGVRIAAWHEDFGSSGELPPAARPGLTAALASVTEHRTGLLVASKRDRVSRDATETALLERDLARLGADLVTADGASRDRLTSGILDLVAEHELGIIRGRITAALEAKRQRGEKLGGAAPYGWQTAGPRVPHPSIPGRFLPQRLEPNPAEQQVIATARQLRDVHGWSLRDIVRELEELGNVSRAGKPFKLTQVARMLAAPPPAAHQTAPLNSGGP